MAYRGHMEEGAHDFQSRHLLRADFMRSKTWRLYPEYPPLRQSGSSITSGGMIRMTLSAAPMVNKPASSRALITSVLGRTHFKPKDETAAPNLFEYRAMPRDNVGQCGVKAPSHLSDFSRNPGAKIMSKTPFPTAIASGLPPKVVPAHLGFIPAAAAFGDKVAPKGNHFLFPFGVAKISVVIPAHS